ncbi:MAG TPA: ATP phosphoribosyltransferase regulatory subunit [Candidatus Limnocylindria bacterium]|jgi:histidyl-tRNA synthetase|nr:ATP phosphoribosyltransferase regulatory subunit [Candidatus Limnocylindria bacterium]
MSERLPGFRDFYPEPLPANEPWSCDLRQHIFRCWRETARRYGFREYDGPPLEPLELYTNKSGAEIVAQLFNFADKGDRAISMRPEMTPTVARMVATAERAYKKPIKWFSLPQLFRYEKQQKGRLREHFQLNCDIFGEADVSADAEIIALLIDVLRALGLTSEDFVIRLSSRQAWQRFFAARGGDPTKAYEFYQVVDKLERERPEVSTEKLAPLGVKLEEVQAFITSSVPEPELQAVLDNLAARGLSDFVKIDYGVIRGLAYYTGVVFEAFDRKGEFRALAGGGRYDQLVKQVSEGKVDLPALGFGMGDVVLAELLKVRKLVPSFAGTVDVVVLIEDETLRADSLKVVQQLREAGRAADYSLTSAKGDKQFKRALELGATHTIRLERGADGNVVAKVKSLKTREEKVVAPAESAGALG